MSRNMKTFYPGKMGSHYWRPSMKDDRYPHLKVPPSPLFIFSLNPPPLLALRFYSNITLKMNSSNYVSLFLFFLFTAIAHLSPLLLPCDDSDLNASSQEDARVPIITPAARPFLCPDEDKFCHQIRCGGAASKTIASLGLWDSPLMTPAHHTLTLVIASWKNTSSRRSSLRRPSSCSRCSS